MYGTAAKKEGCYDNLKVTLNAWDTNLVSSNGQYIAVNWQASGGGAFAILPLDKPRKLPDVIPLARGHTAAVLDTAFSPFNDHMLASASDDGTVGVWKIDDSLYDQFDLTERQKEQTGIKDLAPVVRIPAGTGKKVGQVLFHPTAENVVAASGGDHVVRLLDLEQSTTRVELTGLTDQMQSFSFDYTGSTLAATARDKKLRLFDVRAAGPPAAVTDGHGGIKGQRVVWCGALDRLITTGFSKLSERQMFLWDSRNLSRPLKQTMLDMSSGIIMPFWTDNNVIYLAGKGDGNIRYYEYENDELHELSEYKSTEPQRGMTLIPRNRLNANDNEIARAIKITGNAAQPISFYVPRRESSFQSDIFPPAPSTVPALSANEFFSGKTALPNLISLENGNAVDSDKVPFTQPSSDHVPASATTSTSIISKGGSAKELFLSPPKSDEDPKDSTTSSDVSSSKPALVTTPATTATSAPPTATLSSPAREPSPIPATSTSANSAPTTVPATAASPGPASPLLASATEKPKEETTAPSESETRASALEKEVASLEARLRSTESQLASLKDANAQLTAEKQKLSNSLSAIRRALP